MASKGDKERLYDVAFLMYTQDGKSLTDIEQAIGVSRQTLSRWKNDTLTPGERLDEWDKTREQKRSYVQRLRAVLDKELGYMEGLPPGQIPPALADGITKIGLLSQKLETAEREAQLKSAAMRSAMFLDFVRDVIEFFAGHEPVVVQHIEDNFDDLIQWGRNRYGDNNG